MIEWRQTVFVLLTGLALRVLVIVAGEYIDKFLHPLHFTDIDYRIYTEAAQILANDGSPYERQTYRYPPLVAQLMLLNVYVHNSAGKLVFAVFDTLTSWEYLYSFNKKSESRSEERTGTIPWHWVWCFNPLSVYICCRGSMDSIVYFTVLRFIRALMSKELTLCGILLGFLIFFRIYPIIYLPSCLVFLYNPSRGFRSSFVDFIRLMAPCCLSWGIWTMISFWQFGWDYLDNAVIYHMHRRDHRHNFSPMFLPAYISLARSEKSMPIEVIPTICQIVLMAIVVWKFARSNFPKAVLLQTMIFVAFNKVITGQYFLWYLPLIPLVVPQLPQRVVLWKLLYSFLLLIAGGALWLFYAYQLEFMGRKVFIETWLCSLLFLGCHAWAIKVVSDL